MKTKAYLLALIGFVAFSMASCSDDDDDSTVSVTGISIDASTLEIEVGSGSTLTASLEPDGAEGDIYWESSDATVATVTNGFVYGISEGTATISATSGAYSATCEVTVIPETVDLADMDSSLWGSNYYLISLDEATYDYISDKVVEDFRVNDESTFLYVWNGFDAGTSSGLNFYDQSESWVSLQVSDGAGWSGAGFFVDSLYGEIDMTNMYSNPDDYVFHIGLKSSEESSYLLIFSNGSSEFKVCLGSSAYVDGDVTYEPYADFSRDGEWHAIEIPLSYFHEQGFYYDTTFSNVNILAFLAGSTGGTTIDFDAMFFYEKTY